MSLKTRKEQICFRQSLQPGSRRTPIWSDEEEIPVRDHELKLSIPIENVFFVDTAENFKECVNYFKQIKPLDGRMIPVGFDSEWVTDPSKKFPEDLALIQLAVNCRVYLIDILSFDKQILGEFLQYVFRSGIFLILGFSLSDDKKVLSRYFGRGFLWNRHTGVIDFLKFRTSEIFKTFGASQKFCPYTGKKLAGLSKLCHQVNFVIC